MADPIETATCVAWWNLPRRTVERLRWEWRNRDAIRRDGTEAHKRLGPR